jgi:hypothetical protein
MRLGIGDVCKWAVWITWLKHNIFILIAIVDG